MLLTDDCPANPSASDYLRRGAALFNKALETNCRPASPLDAERQFGRAVHAPACVSGGGRSPLTLGKIAHPMKRHRFHFIAIAGILLVGCEKPSIPKDSKPSIPKDSFRLTVKDLYTDENQRVSVLTIESPTGRGFRLFGDKQGWIAGLMEQTQGLHQEEIWVTACRVEYGGTAYVHAVVRMGGGTAGSTTWKKPKDSRLDQVFALSARDGIYKCESPVVIGRADEENLNLLVGTSVFSPKKSP